MSRPPKAKLTGRKILTRPISIINLVNNQKMAPSLSRKKNKYV
jgi:hypothetical protein